jgi:hypothetical protein
MGLDFTPKLTQASAEEGQDHIASFTRCLLFAVYCLLSTIYVTKARFS